MPLLMEQPKSRGCIWVLEQHASRSVYSWHLRGIIRKERIDGRKADDRLFVTMSMFCHNRHILPIWHQPDSLALPISVHQKSVERPGICECRRDWGCNDSNASRDHQKYPRDQMIQTIVLRSWLVWGRQLPGMSLIQRGSLILRVLSFY